MLKLFGKKKEKQVVKAKPVKPPFDKTKFLNLNPTLVGFEVPNYVKIKLETARRLKLKSQILANQQVINYEKAIYAGYKKIDWMGITQCLYTIQDINDMKQKGFTYWETDWNGDIHNPSLSDIYKYKIAPILLDKIEEPLPLSVLLKYEEAKKLKIFDRFVQYKPGSAVYKDPLLVGDVDLPDNSIQQFLIVYWDKKSENWEEK